VSFSLANPDGEASGGATFYFDLGSPYAYLAGERLDAVISQPVRWQPLLLGGLFKLNGRNSWARGGYQRRQAGMAEIERRVRGYGLPAIRWPDPWPADYLFAMRLATFAFSAGRGREFASCAFRDAFQRGRQLSFAADVLDAAERAGLDRAEAEASAGEAHTKQTLREVTEAAHRLGVFGVPTVAVGEELFWGDDRLEDAAASLAVRASPRGLHR
jgi:2-hydroxychromene-2-carboxylate isomerase